MLNDLSKNNPIKSFLALLKTFWAWRKINISSWVNSTQFSFLVNEHVWIMTVGSVLIISLYFILSWSRCLQLALYFTSWNCIVFPSAFWLSFQNLLQSTGHVSKICSTLLTLKHCANMFGSVANSQKGWFNLALK